MLPGMDFHMGSPDPHRGLRGVWDGDDGDS